MTGESADADSPEGKADPSRVIRGSGLVGRLNNAIEQAEAGVVECERQHAETLHQLRTSREVLEMLKNVKDS